MTVARVDYDIPMELAEAQRIHEIYHQIYPGVPEYQHDQISFAKEFGFVQTLAGRRVIIDGNWRGKFKWSMESTAINYPIQGTGGEQKYLALAMLKAYLLEHQLRFAWELHDGVYFYVKKTFAEQAAREMKYILDNLPYERAWGFKPPIPMPWDCKIGPTWGTLKGFE